MYILSYGVSSAHPRLYRIPIDELLSQIVLHFNFCSLLRQLLPLLSKIGAEHGKFT